MCHNTGDMGCCRVGRSEARHQGAWLGSEEPPCPLGPGAGLGEQSSTRAQRYLFPSPFRRRRVLLAWMCQRDSEVATCRTMMLMESTWMEKSWGEGAAVRDV